MVWMLPMSCHMLMALQTINNLVFLTYTELSFNTNYIPCFIQIQSIGLCEHEVKVRVGIDGYTNFTNARVYKYLVLRT
ncbi:hypothetical protein Hanom_Chr08g00727781 [Helianthus anomalus]